MLDRRGCKPPWILQFFHQNYIKRKIYSSITTILNQYKSLPELFGLIFMVFLCLLRDFVLYCFKNLSSSGSNVIHKKSLNIYMCKFFHEHSRQQHEHVYMILSFRIWLMRFWSKCSIWTFNLNIIWLNLLFILCIFL